MKYCVPRVLWKPLNFQAFRIAYGNLVNWAAPPHVLSVELRLPVWPPDEVTVRFAPALNVIRARKHDQLVFLADQRLEIIPQPVAEVFVRIEKQNPVLPDLIYDGISLIGKIPTKRALKIPHLAMAVSVNPRLTNRVDADNHLVNVKKRRVDKLPELLYIVVDDNPKR